MVFIILAVKPGCPLNSIGNWEIRVSAKGDKDVLSIQNFLFRFQRWPYWAIYAKMIAEAVLEPVASGYMRQGDSTISIRQDRINRGLVVCCWSGDIEKGIFRWISCSTLRYERKYANIHSIAWACTCHDISSSGKAGNNFPSPFRPPAYYLRLSRPRFGLSMILIYAQDVILWLWLCHSRRWLQCRFGTLSTPATGIHWESCSKPSSKQYNCETIVISLHSGESLFWTKVAVFLYATYLYYYLLW